MFGGFLNYKLLKEKPDSFPDPTLPPLPCPHDTFLSALKAGMVIYFIPIATSSNNVDEGSDMDPVAVFCAWMTCKSSSQTVCPLPGLEEMCRQPWKQPRGQYEVGGDHRYHFIDGWSCGLLENVERRQLTL